MQGDKVMNEPGRRRAKIAAFLLISSFLAVAAGAQRLWRVGEVSRAPEGPAMVTAGSTVGAGLAGKPIPVESVEVQVTYDYLRLGMGYLELPLADGSVIEAENAVFEDRGDGNLMWTGEVPGAGYESVLFTLQDGHLVGWFGEPGGPKYVVRAGPDGRGTVSVEQGPTGDWCGVGKGESTELATRFSPVANVAGDRPASGVSRSTGNRLDILVLYPDETERYWRVIGGPALGVQQLEDYLNMVFRNGRIPATAHLVSERWDPTMVSHPSEHGGHFVNRAWNRRFLAWDLARDPGVSRLQERHRADLIHFISDVLVSGVAGSAFLRSDFEPRVWWGWSIPEPSIFAHEIGHNLGADHEPAAFGDRFAEIQREALRPYIFGHADMTSCAARKGKLRCPVTVMSNGVEASPRGHLWYREPYYSSVRHKPNGLTIGVAGTSEVERLFHETVPVAARSGEEDSYRYEQYPRRVTARWTGRDSVRVTWLERDISTLDLWVVGDGLDRHYSLLGGLRLGNWAWFHDEERSSENLTPILDGGGKYLEGVEIEGLRPGGRYRLAALGNSRCDDEGCIVPVRSDVFHLSPPQAAAGAPAAPKRLAAQVTGEDSVRLTWQGASPDGGGYEVWWGKWSGKQPDETWRRYGAALPAHVRSVPVGGLSADEEIWLDEFRDPDEEKPIGDRGRYSFLVVSYNDVGFRASEPLDFEFMPGPFPKATRSGEVPGCADRYSGLRLDGYEVWLCVETPAGERRRAWDYRLDSEQSGLLYFFGRDNVEVLVKVLDGCAVNGHRWVFVAPVTNLGFRLAIAAPGPWEAYGEKRRKYWFYDSARRPQDRFGSVTGSFGRYQDGEWHHFFAGNPQGRTARTVGDTTAFPCTTAEIAAAKAKADQADGGHASFLRSRGWTGEGTVSAGRATSGARADCEPAAAALRLAGGYKVSLCYETYANDTGEALDYGLDSSQSGLLYFFERDNAEVLVKVLDGCGVNGHRWVFVAPVTDLAFNLVVESPDGGRWTHTNRLGQTADAASDVAAFPCSA